MSLYRRISDFIAGRAPEQLCDDCVADYLALSRRQVTAAGPQVRADPRFRRFSGRCSGCCTDRMVTMLPEVAGPFVGTQFPPPRPVARPSLR